MAPRTKPKRERQRHYFREWRQKKYPLQADAEEALQWSQSKISRLEKGETPYNQDDLEAAAELFGCTPSDIISRDPDQAISGQSAVLALLRQIKDLPEESLIPIYGVIEGFIKRGAGSQTQIPAHDQSAPASRRRATAP